MIRLKFFSLLFVAGCLLLAACTPSSTTSAVTPPPDSDSSLSNAESAAKAEIPEGERAQVTHIFDGDTIEVELDGRTYRLRYIGVDTPEREEPFYKDAADFNRDLVKDQTVILVRDVSDTDRYGRLLRYVYLEDGTFVNAELMRGGFARLVTFPPDVAQTDYLRGLQTEARDAGAGMWGRPDLTGPCDCDRNLYNCRDFQSRDEAQTCFEYCLDATGRDVHKLDGGGDGLVCEFLP